MFFRLSLRFEVDRIRSAPSEGRWPSYRLLRHRSLSGAERVCVIDGDRFVGGGDKSCEVFGGGDGERWASVGWALGILGGAGHCIHGVLFPAQGEGAWSQVMTSDVMNDVYRDVLRICCENLNGNCEN